MLTNYILLRYSCLWWSYQSFNHINHWIISYLGKINFCWDFLVMATNQTRLPALPPLPVWFVEGSSQVVLTTKKKLFHCSFIVFILSFIFCQTLGPELTQSSRRILTEAPSLNSHTMRLITQWRSSFPQLWKHEDIHFIRAVRIFLITWIYFVVLL